MSIDAHAPRTRYDAPALAGFAQSLLAAAGMPAILPALAPWAEKLGVALPAAL